MESCEESAVESSLNLWLAALFRSALSNFQRVFVERSFRRALGRYADPRSLDGTLSRELWQGCWTRMLFGILTFCQAPKSILGISEGH